MNDDDDEPFSADFLKHKKNKIAKISKNSLIRYEHDI